VQAAKSSILMMLNQGVGVEAVAVVEQNSTMGRGSDPSGGVVAEVTGWEASGETGVPHFILEDGSST
jgi:hypothetical protein